MRYSVIEAAYLPQGASSQSLSSSASFRSHPFGRRCKFGYLISHPIKSIFLPSSLSFQFLHYLHYLMQTMKQFPLHLLDTSCLLGT